MELAEREKMMLEKLGVNMHSDFFISMLQDEWNSTQNVQYVGDLIGEAYNFHIIFKDGDGFEDYMRMMHGLYSRYHAKQISPQDFERNRSEIIAKTIAVRLGIDITKEISPEDAKRVKDYFLLEYVQNGFVSHSFPEAYRESIEQNGLIASTEKRSGQPDEIKDIQKMFMEQGVVAPLGGYPFYGGSGIYYEHDMRSVFHHAVDSPEWFKWFTSSDHLTTYSNDVASSPYVLRDEAACRRNVSDLCANAGLSPEQTAAVMDFYGRSYDKFSSPRLNVALIPKREVGKDDIGAVGADDKDVISTISHVMRDGERQYTEHDGNVHRGTISPESFGVTTIPEASKYVAAPSEYRRESKEHLTNPEANMALIDRISGEERLVDDMREPLEGARGVIESKREAERTVDTPLDKPAPAAFDERSDEEVAVAAQIREKNAAISKEKEADKQLDKGHAYVLKKKDDKPNGFISSMVISIVVGLTIAMLFGIIVMLLV